MRNQLSFGPWLGVVGVAVALTALACDDSTPADSPPGGAGGSGGAGGGVGAGGSDSECTIPADCGAETTCLTNTCVNGTCGTSMTPIDTPCTEDGGQYCDGVGSCVECNTAAQCGGPSEDCDQHVCVFADDCMNGVKDSDETDVDCGGPDCPPCDNAGCCVIFSDCLSSFCKNAAGPCSSCEPCGDDNDCTDMGAAWCDGSLNGGTCVDQKNDGEPCTGANECLSGSCPGDDGVCCDSPCTALCQACLQSKTGSPDGICDDVTAGTDPDDECPGPGSCNGSGSCG